MSESEEQPSPASPRDVLTQVEAEERAARVSHVSYDIAIELTRGSPTYRGDIQVRFQLQGKGDLFLDFREHTIESVELNGEAIEPETTPYRLILPAELLIAPRTARSTSTPTSSRTTRTVCSRASTSRT